MSQHDLSSGGRWSQELSEELERSSFGLICLTPSNLLSPWILFEAGALTKHVKGRACCVLFKGLRPQDVSGPLSQFQHVSFSEPDFQKLLVDINSQLEAPLDQASLEMIFSKWWPDLAGAINEALQSVESGNAKEYRRDANELLEEILLRVRNLERTIQYPPKLRHASGAVHSVDDILARLTSSQLDLLRELATPSESRNFISEEELYKRYSGSDINLLSTIGLLVKTKDGFTIVHDALAKYITEQL